MRRAMKCVIGLMVLAGFALAQTPQPPALPRLPEPVIPAANVVPATRPAAPVDRFVRDPHSFPEMTIQAVYSVRSSGDWLMRLNQSDGRFLPGFNPTLSRWLDDDSDTRQGIAAVALARTATFTGDAKLQTAALQAILSLLSLTRNDPADAAVRVPMLSSDRGNKVAYAALTAIAIYELAEPDAKLLAKAEELCAYLRKHVKPDGSVISGEEQPTPSLPGLVFQALTGSDKRQPAEWKREAVAGGIAYYRPLFKKSPSVELASTLLPAVVDFSLHVKSEGGFGFAFEMADRLCDMQYTATDSRSRSWIGGFKLGAGEPTSASLPCAHGVACALQLAAQVPDATRFAKYRVVTSEALKFGRSLQLTADNTRRQFEKGYAAQVLVGGVCGGPSDGCLRVEPTADLIAAQIRFLASGGEKAN